MRVSSNTESTVRSSKKTEKPEKKTLKKAHVATSSTAPAEKSDEASGDTKVKLSSKAKAAKEPKKADKAAPKEAAPEPKAEEVAAPAAPKPEGPSDKELKEAETIMSHINSGKLGDAERDMALKRVGDLLKRYGNA